MALPEPANDVDVQSQRLLQSQQTKGVPPNPAGKTGLEGRISALRESEG